MVLKAFLRLFPERYQVLAGSAAVIGAAGIVHTYNQMSECRAARARAFS
jgi:hypothetical protein